MCRKQAHSTQRNSASQAFSCEETSLPRSRFTLLAGAAIAAFLVAQAIRPSIPHPPATAELDAPPQVKAIFERRCYACHSNENRLAWFDYVVPGYWLVAHDIKEARAHMNFSEFGNMPKPMQKATLYEAVNQIQLGAMPLASYRAVHKDAAVTPEELAVLKNWLAPFAPAKPAPAAPATHAVAGGPVSPSLNGVPFFPDYKNWRTVSTTDRGDNGTLRVITGNDIAIHAIESHQTGPWPDGTVFAKIAWKIVDDGQGHLHAGPFIQVEFMEKDHVKWASTAGWGWARWRGVDLKPYGKNKMLANECVSCHRPVRGDDWVYTMPMDREAATANGGQP